MCYIGASFSDKIYMTLCMVYTLLYMQPLKACFETKNVAKLQEVLAQLPKDDATYHMRRCIDAGLWVPDAKAAGTCTLYVQCTTSVMYVVCVRIIVGAHKLLIRLTQWKYTCSNVYV